MHIIQSKKKKLGKKGYNSSINVCSNKLAKTYRNFAINFMIKFWSSRDTVNKENKNNNEIKHFSLVS